MGMKWHRIYQQNGLHVGENEGYDLKNYVHGQYDDGPLDDMGYSILRQGHPEVCFLGKLGTK